MVYVLCYRQMLCTPYTPHSLFNSLNRTINFMWSNKWMSFLNKWKTETWGEQQNHTNETAELNTNTWTNNNTENIELMHVQCVLCNHLLCQFQVNVSYGLLGIEKEPKRMVSKKRNERKTRRELKNMKNKKNILYRKINIFGSIAWHSFLCDFYFRSQRTGDRILSVHFVNLCGILQTLQMRSLKMVRYLTLLEI